MSAVFDRIGEAYEQAFNDREAQLGLGRALVAGLPCRARVLDHGCGAGLPTARQLADSGLEVLGVDESERMLRLARQRVPAARFEQRDLRELDPDLGTFDAVTSFFALLMLSQADIPRVLTGLAARMREGGLLALGMVAGDLDAVEIEFLGVPMAVSAYPTAELSDRGAPIMSTNAASTRTRGSRSTGSSIPPSRSPSSPATSRASSGTSTPAR
jgi:trans-aconitate methyltransferase